MTFAPDRLSHQLPAMTGLAHNLLYRRSAFRQGQDNRIGLFAAKYPSYCRRSAAARNSGSIVVAPDCAADPPGQPLKLQVSRRDVLSQFARVHVVAGGAQLVELRIR